MTTSTIFGFSVEEADGKLVITLNGTVGTELAQRLRHQIEAGRGAELLRYFAPVGGLKRLLLSSPAVQLNGRSASVNGVCDPSRQSADQTPIEQVFNQGFEGGLADFEQQLQTFEASLGDIEAEVKAAIVDAPSPKKAKKG